jgi:hypothetical protein
MSTCPCCSDRLLRHVRQGKLYWLCRSCWAEMPNFDELLVGTAPAKAKPALVPTAQPLRIAASQEQPALVQHSMTSTSRRPKGLAA